MDINGESKMSNRTIWLMFACAAGGVLLAGADAAAGAPEATKTCAVCHSDNGVSDQTDVPTIAGVSDFFLENQLAIFVEKARPCAAQHFSDESEVDAEDHCALAASLGEDEVTELAEYYSALPFAAVEQVADPALAANGKSIHEAKCERCHTDGGSLALDDAGILAGQPKHYLLEQFEHYKNSERWQPEKMQPVMAELADEDMQALAEYYAGEGARE